MTNKQKFEQQTEINKHITKKQTANKDEQATIKLAQAFSRRDKGR